MKTLLISALTLAIASCGLVEDMRTNGSKSKRGFDLGRSGSGNSLGLTKKVNPNSIPLIKNFTPSLYDDGSRVLFTHDAKLAIGYEDIGNTTTLRVSALKPLPYSSVGANNILSVKSPETSNARSISTSLNGNVGRNDPFQGHLAVDPRYSEGFPFRVNSVNDCTTAQPWKTDEKTTLNGIYECYYLMHFDTVLQSATEGVGIVKAHFTVVTRAFGTDGKRLSSPSVEYAKFNSSYRRLKDSSGKGVRGGIELSGTADGRVLVNIKGKVAWNEKPWEIDGWNYSTLSRIHNDSDTLICRKIACSEAQKEKFGDVYPFAKYPIRNYRGDFFPNRQDLLTCGYLWMHPEGTDVFCRMNTPETLTTLQNNLADQQPNNFKLHTYPPRSAHESSTGMYYQIMGQSTRWTIRTIDGGINTQRHAKNQNVIERPFSLLFLGMSSGFWSDELVDASNTSLPLNPRGMNYQFLTQPNHIALSTASKFSRYNLESLISSEQPSSKLQYWETDISDCTDSNVLVALRFKAPYYNDVDRAPNARTKDVLDTACHFPAKKKETESGADPIVTKIPNTQNTFLTADLGTLGNSRENRIDVSTVGSMMGFKGEGLWVKKGGGLTHKVGPTHPHLKAKPDGFSVEFAVRLLSSKRNAGFNQKILTIPGIAEIGVKRVGGAMNKVRFYAKKLGASAEEYVESKDISTSFDYPIRSSQIVLGDWHHVGIRIIPTFRKNSHKLELIHNGLRVGSKFVPASDLKGKSDALAISGDCSSCTDNLYIIDEIVMSSVKRSLDYFAAGAYAVSTERQQFLDYNQKAQLLKNFGMSKLRNSNVDLAEEVFIPAKFAPFADPAAKPKADALVALGKSLFNSSLLSVDRKLEPQRDINTNKVISCRSCHIPGKAYTDGKKVAVGTGIGTLNTPTIRNRSLGRKQFFDQRADDLFDQVLAPIRNPAEMNSNVNHVLKAIKKDAALSDMFAQANLKVDRNGLALGLGAFTLKQTLVIRQRQTISNAQADLGQKLFFGKARCASCHNGASLTNERMHDTGVSSEAKAFKTPSLVRAGKTAPYFHDGSMATLKEVVEFYNSGFVQKRSQTRPLDIDMRPLGLSADERNNLVEYLKNLPHIVPR